MVRAVTNWVGFGAYCLATIALLAKVSALQLNTHNSRLRINHSLRPHILRTDNPPRTTHPIQGRANPWPYFYAIREVAMSEQLYPKERRKRDLSHRPWRIDYRLAYDGGGSSWTGYYNSRFTARLFAFWNVRFASWGGTAILSKKP